MADMGERLLAQQGCLKALRDVKPVKMDDDGCEELQMVAVRKVRLGSDT